MKMMKNFIAVAVILTIFAALFGCAKGKTQETEESKVVENPQTQDEVETPEEPEEAEDVQVLDKDGMVYKDSDYRSIYANVFDFDSYDGQPMFAVAFLGYGDRMEFRHTYVEGVFESLGDLAIEQIGHIDYEGDEWYLVVPRYMEDVNITNLDTGEVHTIYNGEAFTVKCNLSELHPNIEISTELNLGGHKFSPQIGGDGRLVPNPDIWDITDYTVMED